MRRAWEGILSILSPGARVHRAVIFLPMNFLNFIFWKALVAVGVSCGCRGGRARRWVPPSLCGGAPGSGLQNPCQK